MQVSFMGIQTFFMNASHVLRVALSCKSASFCDVKCALTAF